MVQAGVLRGLLVVTLDVVMVVRGLVVRRERQGEMRMEMSNGGVGGFWS